MRIAVTGCRRILPPEFPTELKENSGNMIHGNAPFEMYPNAVGFADGDWRASGARTFPEFVSKHCSHLIVTLANSFKSGESDGTRYTRFIEMVEQHDKPVVIFGLGIQAQSAEVEALDLHPEAIRMMKVLGERCTMVGVRGEMTAAAFRELAGVENTFVTGCPSVFSRPAAIEQLARRERRPRVLRRRRGRAFSVTKLISEDELAMLYENVLAGSYLIDPASVENYLFYLSASGQDPQTKQPPRHFRPMVANTEGFTRDDLASYFKSRYKLFRDPHQWYEFNKRNVSFTYGTRFHVNVASLLSGVPALWLTHDARTEELTEFLHLPAIPLRHAVGVPAHTLQERTDYADFLTHIPMLFDRFNQYLAINGLPEIAAPKL